MYVNSVIGNPFISNYLQSYHIHSRNSFLKLGTIIYYQNYAIFLKNICTVIIRLGERKISVTCLSFFIKNAKNEQIVPYHLIGDI